MSEISRRSFVAGAAASVALTVGTSVALADAAPEAASGDVLMVGVPQEPARTEGVDVVVVGSGIGGFYGAMIAKEQMPEAAAVSYTHLLTGPTPWPSTPSWPRDPTRRTPTRCPVPAQWRRATSSSWTSEPVWATTAVT